MATPFLTRAALELRPPRAITALLTAEGITAHYAGPSPWGKVDRSSAARFEATTDHARCATIWRAWQAFHMNDRGWSDIAYNSGICPHGWRLEGRGIGVRSAANGTSAGNRRSYAFCYLGGEGDPLTDPAREAFLDEAARYGVPLRWEHRDWKSTQCAGPAIRAWKLAGWPRPTSARPDSSPITEPRQEVDDDMPLVIAADGKPAALLSGGVMVPFRDANPTLGNLNRNGVPTVKVSPGDYELFKAGFAPPSSITTRLDRIEMRREAVRQIEEREERARQASG